MSAVLVAVAKSEKPYIEEWVRYHLALGFARIYLYDNEDYPTYAPLLHKFGAKVSVIWIPGNDEEISIQKRILQHFQVNFLSKGEFKYATHIDCDEFICLKKHNHINQFCAEYLKNRVGCVVMPWVFFGDGGRRIPGPEPVLERFVLRGRFPAYNVKSIFLVEALQELDYWHIPTLKEGWLVQYTAGTQITTKNGITKAMDVVQINHYKCKTWTEFKQQRQRGRAAVPFAEDQVAQDRLKELFSKANQNVVMDTIARDFYKLALKRPGAV